MSSLATVEGRRNLFRQHVLRSGRFALLYSEEWRHDDTALERQRDNILQAMAACDRHAGAWQMMVAIALSLHGHMERRGDWEIWERCLARAVEASRKTGDARAEGTLLNYLGEIRRNRGRWQSARVLHEEARKIFQDMQDDAGIAASHRHLGRSWWLQGRWDRAWACFEVALKIAEGLGEDETGLTELYRDIGSLFSYRGEWKKALEYLYRGGEMAGRLGDTARQTRICGSIGYVLWRRGEWSEAICVLQWTIETAAACGYELSLAIACNNLAAVLLSRGEWKRALQYLERDLNIVERIGEIHLAAHAYDDMGEAYRQAGQWKQARRYLARSVEIKCGLDDLSGLAATYHHMGLLCSDTGEHERALTYHRRGLQLRERLRAEQDVAEILVSLAWAYHRARSTRRGREAQVGSPGGPASLALTQWAPHREWWEEMDAVAERATALAHRLGRRDLLAHASVVAGGGARSSKRARGRSTQGL